MKYCFTFLFACFSLCAFSQRNCNIYKEDKACYEACLESEKAIRHPQGSRESQLHFDRAIELCPTFDYAYFEKAVPYLKRGQFIAWKKLIDKAVELNPEAHLGYRGWCRYQFLRDYKGAIEDIERLESLATYDVGMGANGDYHLIVTKALCYKALNQKENALSILRNQLARADYEAMSFDYLHLGVLQLELNQPEEAVTSLLKQVEVNDYLAETYFYLGKATEALGQQGSAQEYFAKALTLYEGGQHLRDPYTHPMDRVFKVEIEAQLARLEEERVAK